jgi:stress-induced morphogen
MLVKAACSLCLLRASSGFLVSVAPASKALVANSFGSSGVARYHTTQVSAAVYSNLVASYSLRLCISDVHASQARLARSAAVTMSSTGPVYDAIETKLSEGLSPAHLQVINESHMHSGPATESHFKVKHKLC